MKNKEIFTVCFCLLIITGVSLNFDFYQNAVHPLILTKEHLDEIVGSSETPQIQEHLIEIKQNLSRIMENLPEDKNPVWFFPTESTNFLRIENDVDVMIVSIDKLSEIPTDTSEYHTGMIDINDRANLLRENLQDTRGFLYGSATNVFFTLVWMTGVVGLTKMWIGE